jgi:hypothetical protein
MSKSYPEQLGEWVKQQAGRRRDLNLVAFLAVQNDVKAAMETGYAVKTVWANMRESKRIAFGYDTFIHYVNRTIRRPQCEPAAPGKSGSVTMRPDNRCQKSNFARVKQAPAIQPATLTGFTFNAVPNKEELL